MQMKGERQDSMGGERQDTVVQSITQQIADREDVTSDDLPSLYQAIDPTIFEYLPDRATLEFRYCGYAVVVNGNGTVTVEDPTEDN